MKAKKLGHLRRRAAALGLVPALLLGAVGTVVAPRPAAANSVVHLSPEKVLAQGDVIFQGTVVASAYGWTDDRHLFATTEYTLRVDRVVLDRDGWLAARTTNGNTVLSFMGGTQEGVTYNVSGMPSMAVGESAFFFMTGDDLRNNAMSPVIGVSEGLYRVAALNGEWKVFTPGGCGGPPRPVDFRYFTKFRDAQVNYSPDEFAAEIARALPLALLSPELRITQAGPVPAHLAGQAFGPADHGTVQVGPATAVAAGPNQIPAGPADVFVRPVPPGPRTFTEGSSEQFDSPGALEWGRRSDPPAYPMVFNVPLGVFRNPFTEEQGRWNRYASGAMRFYVESNNSIGWPNGRFETGFLNNQQMIDLYGRGWGATTLARCISREGVFTDRIVEADIAFNVAQTFSDSQAVVYANSSINSYRTTALHELGHAFGRVHAWESDPGSVYPSCMNYTASGFYDAESGRVFADDSESMRASFQAQAVYQSDFGITLWRNSGTLVPFSFNPDGTTALSVNGVTGLSMPVSVLQGNFFSVSNIWLENIGTVTRASTIDWWLDPTPFDNDLTGGYYCSSTNLGTLARFNGVAVSTFIPAPQDIPPGNYALFAVIAGGDAVADNDFAWSQNTIRVDFNPAFSPPANNSRSTPQAIGLGTFTGSTEFATNDGTATCGLSNTSPDVWFTFIAPYAGAFAIDTCLGTSYDTVLSLELRTALLRADGTFDRWIYIDAGCNDDALSVCAGSNRSRLFINNLAAGAVLRIRLGGFNGARGPYTLRTQLDPANDFCANAVPVTAGTYTATLAGASNDRTGSCGQSQSTPDVWFRYTWPVGCNSVNLNTIGSDFDTVLEVLPVCSAFNITVLGCNDDCGAVGPSCLTINRGNETTLRIRVTRYGGTPAAGNRIVLNVSTPTGPHDFCTGAATLPDGDYSFNNNCGTADPLPLPASCGSSLAENDFWFRYTAPVTGQLRVSVNTPFPAALALYPGFACPGDPEQAIRCNIGLPGAAIQADVTAGETFLIRMGGSVQPGFGVPVGTGTFSFHTVEQAPPNDGAFAAEAIAAGARLQPNLALANADGSSSADRVAGGPDVWFAFTAPGDGTLDVRTCGTLTAFGLDTVVSIHTVQEDGTLLELTASDTYAPAPCPEGSGPLPEDASVSLAVTGGNAYLIRVAATDPSLVGTGQFYLSVDFAAPNDSCAAPGMLADGDNAFSTAGATADGPAHDCFDGTEPDAWFTYTAACTGITRISTCAQPYDTKIAVYALTCPTIDDLPIACNNDDGPECLGVAASVDFPSALGSVYFIRIGGDVPSSSIVTVTCTTDANPADNCGNATAVSDGDNNFTTDGATPDGVAEGCFDGTENDLWFIYTATCDGMLTVSTCSMNIDTRISIYDGVDCPAATLLGCGDNDGPTCAGLAASVNVPAIAGQIFQIRVASAETTPQILTISCGGMPTDPADFNGDGEVNPDDLADYIGAYFSQPADPRADFNGDGEINPDDLADYIGAYFS